MSELASEDYQQVRFPNTGPPNRAPTLRRVLLFFPVLTLVFLGAIAQSEMSVWWGASAGSLSAVAVTTLSTETKVVAAGVLTGGHVPAAVRAVRDERGHVEAEQAGFEEFAEEVQSLSTASQSVMGTNAHTVNTSLGNRVLGRVRDTYRETVMSTPDFDCEYGESFHEHVAAEFGDDVASLLIDGHHLNEPVKQLLVQQARQSAQQRGILQEALAVEQRSLDDVDSELEPVQELLTDIERTDLSDLSLSRLVSLDADVRTHQERCRRILDTRQRDIHTVNRRVNGESKTLTQVYLYRNLPVRFPALSTTLDCLHSLDETRSAIVRAVCQSH